MPARTTILFSSGYNKNTTGVSWLYPSNIGDNANNTTLNTTSRQAYVGVACTFKKLTISVITENGATGRTATLYKNGSTSALTISIGNGLTGQFSDISNTVSMAVGDLFEYGINGTNTNVWAMSNVSIEIEHSTNAIGIIANWFESTNNATSVRYSTLAGYGSQVSTEADVEQPMDLACTLNRLSVYMTTNSRNTTLTVAIRKNNVDTAMTTSIAAGTTGRFTNPSSTASIAANDNMSIGWTPVAGSGSHGVSYVTVTADFGAVDDFVVMNAAHTSAQWSAGVATKKAKLGTYLPTGSWISASSYPVMISAWTLTKARIHILTNATTGASTFAFRKNDVVTGISISIPSGTTGHFTTTGSVDYAANDNIAVSYQATTTGTTTGRGWSAVMSAPLSVSPSVQVMVA